VDRLALGDGTVAEVAGERALDHLAAHVHVGELRGRGEHDAVGVLDVDGGDGDGVADLHAGVRASVRVDEDGSFWGVRAAGPHLRDRGALTADLDGVAAEEAEPLSGGFGEPGDAPARVPLLGGTHREPEAGGVVHTLRSGHSPFTLTRPGALSRCRRARDPSAADRNPLTPAEPVDGYATDRGTCAATVHVAGDARQRFHDSNGYGRPLGGNEIALSRVETAHLLFRGDLSGVSPPDADPVGFERFFVESAAAADRFAVRYLVLPDLRDRGFYLARPRAVARRRRRRARRGRLRRLRARFDARHGDVKYPVQVVGERESLPAAGLAGRTLAVVDEESDITYFAATRGEIAGATDYEPPDQLDGVLLSDRVVVWDAPKGSTSAASTASRSPAAPRRSRARSSYP